MGAEVERSAGMLGEEKLELETWKAVMKGGEVSATGHTSCQ